MCISKTTLKIPYSNIIGKTCERQSATLPKLHGIYYNSPSFLGHRTKKPRCSAHFRDWHDIIHWLRSASCQSFTTKTLKTTIPYCISIHQAIDIRSYWLPNIRNCTESTKLLTNGGQPLATQPSTAALPDPKTAFPALNKLCTSQPIHITPTTSAIRAAPHRICTHTHTYSSPRYSPPSPVCCE